MPLETQVALVVPEANGRLTIYSCTQAMYFSMGVVAAHLQVPLNKLKFVGGTVGGGFGGKVDTASDTICALLALKARQARSSGGGRARRSSSPPRRARRGTSSSRTPSPRTAGSSAGGR